MVLKIDKNIEKIRKEKYVILIKANVLLKLNFFLKNIFLLGNNSI